MYITLVTISHTGIRPKLNADQFQDLLGAEGFNVHSKNKEPQTLSDMQDIGDLKKEQDPDRAKVMPYSWKFLIKLSKVQATFENVIF